MRFSEYKRMVLQAFPDVYAELSVKQQMFSQGNTLRKREVFSPVDWLDSVRNEMFLRGTPHTDELYKRTREHLLELEATGDHGLILDE